MICLYKLSKVSKIYKNKQENKYALKDINLELPEKGFISIVGESGSGKTTLLNILGGIDSVSSGEVLFNGVNISKMKRIDDIRNSMISIIFQEYNLLGNYNVFDNISIGLEFQGEKNKETIKSIVEEKLKIVGLDGYSQRRIDTLSGGEKQRVAIARALAKNSKVILADEITAALDNKNSISILEVLKKISNDVLVVLVTHNESYANIYSDRVIRIDDGHLEEKIENLTCDTKTDTYKHLRISPKFFIKNSLNNLLHSKLLAIIAFITSLVLFTLLISTLSLVNYSFSTAYIETFESNDNFLLPISFYSENKLKTYNPTTKVEEYVGVTYTPNSLKITDKAILEEKVLGRVPIYESYFYNPWFECFNSKCNTVLSFFYSHSFKFITTVDSFIGFNQPLIKGRLPEKEDEILIYDYMEESLLNAEVFKDDVLNEILYDHVGGIKFKIVGILKSSYKNYEFLNTKHSLSRNDEYAISYLNELETIYCYKSYFESLPRNNKYYFDRVVPDHFEYSTTLNGQKIYDFDDLDNVVTCGTFDLINDFDYDFLYSGLESNDFGYVITKGLAMKIAKATSEEEFDSMTFGTDFHGSEAFCKAHVLDIYGDIYDRTVSYAEYRDSIYGVIVGITKNLDDESITCVNSYPLSNEKFSFRNFVLGLSTDKSINTSIIDDFNVVTKDDAYYENLKDGEVITGFIIYSSFTPIVLQADKYVPYVSGMIKNISIYLSVLVSLIVFYFTFICIRNNYYKIGIYKSMGMSNLKITLLYAFEPIFILTLSFIISIPFSHILMHYINADFIKDFSMKISILNVEQIGIIYSVLLGIVVLIVGCLIPLIRLFMQSPKEMIVTNNG